MKKMAKAYVMDMRRGCLMQLLALLIVVPLSILLIFVPLYYANRPGTTAEKSLMIMAVPMSLFLFLTIGGSLAAVKITRSRRAHRLDAAITPLGLAGKSYLMNGRQYHGAVDGRDADIMFYRGPTLVVYVRTSVMTRMAVALREDYSPALSRPAGAALIQLPGPDFDRLTAFGADESWAREFLARPGVASAIRGLLEQEGDFLLRQLHLMPGAFYLRLYRNKNMFRCNFTAGDVRSWLSTLRFLAESAEGLNKPDMTLEPSLLEEQSRTGDVKWGRIMIFLLVLIGVPAVIFAVLIFILLR